MPSLTSIVLTKYVQNFAKQKINLQIFAKSGEISPNLVTLLIH